MIPGRLKTSGNSDSACWAAVHGDCYVTIILHLHGTPAFPSLWNSHKCLLHNDRRGLRLNKHDQFLLMLLVHLFPCRRVSDSSSVSTGDYFFSEHISKCSCYWKCHAKIDVELFLTPILTGWQITKHWISLEPIKIDKLCLKIYGSYLESCSQC